MKASSTQNHNRRALAAQCEVHEALASLALRWKIAVVNAIGEGAATYSALQQALPGVTDQVLARRLRELVREGLVAKSLGKAVDGANASPSYALLPLGREALDIAQDICRWAKRRQQVATPHQPVVRAADTASAAATGD